MSGYQVAPGAGDASVGNGQLEAFKKSQAELIEKVLKLEGQVAKEKLEAFVEKELAKFPESIREHMRVRLMGAESLDEAKRAVDVELAHIEQVAKKLGVPRGKGRQFAPDPDPEKSAIQEDHQMSTWARLCGTDQN